jgi:mannose-6-phosphate isomerase-like protein (cupin superfamily)
MNVHRIDALTYAGEDFRPVVAFGGWLVALMNWSPRFDVGGWGTLERHAHTDEVFVLQKGRSLLFVAGEGGLQVVDMTPGVVYNVTQGSWHNVVGTQDVQWLIVESGEDPTQPTEYRAMSDAERNDLCAAFPAWLGTG